MEILSRLRERILQLWESWERPWLIAGSAAAVFVVALSSLAFLYLQGPDYVPLFTELAPEDAAEVTSYLEENGVEYRLLDGGKEILVPASEANRAKLQLASRGLPKGGKIGFEIFDQTDFAATDFEQRISYLRALQGELARTIQSMGEVSAARVHLVIPEESIFDRKTKVPKAAVFVKLATDSQLSVPQIKGIMNLVSSSVEGLQTEEVTVVDFHGRVLSGHVDEEAERRARTQSNLELERTFEQRLQSQLQTLLSQVLGPGNVVVRVTARLNFDQKVVEENLFQPASGDEGLARSVQELQEQFSGASEATEGGVPGDESNVPTYEEIEEGSEETSYNKSERTVNYELNEIQKHTVISPGAVERISVAVVVNAELTEEERASIEATTRAAIGFDQNRNDRISVIGYPFENELLASVKERIAEEQQLEEEQAEEIMGYPRQAVIYGAAGAALLVLVIFAVRLWLVRRRRESEQRELEELRQELMREQAAAQQAEEVGEEEEEKQPEEEPEEDEFRRQQNRIRELARRDPQRVAEILRIWLTR